MTSSFSSGSFSILSSVLQRQSQSKHLLMMRSLSDLNFAKNDLGMLQGLFGLVSSIVLNAQRGLAFNCKRASGVRSKFYCIIVLV